MIISWITSPVTSRGVSANAVFGRSHSRGQNTPRRAAATVEPVNASERVAHLENSTTASACICEKKGNSINKEWVINWDFTPNRKDFHPQTAKFPFSPTDINYSKRKTEIKT